MKLIWLAIQNPKRVVLLTVLLSLIFAAFIPSIKIDTDPENMLAENESVRVMHNQLKDHYNMHDIIVLGIVNEVHPDGVFNQSSLTNIYNLSQYINELELDTEVNPNDSSDIPQITGIIKRDVMGPANIDHIESLGGGVLKFDWLMSEAPKNNAEALEIRDRLMSNEMFKNTIVSEDGKAICLYVPISSKDISYEISTLLKEESAKYQGDDQFYITGLPVAEDTFGIEMFIQMAITAPLAMFCIFLLMLYFFKKLKLIWSPMIVAMVSVICTMGLLIGSGFTVHIMSSMIPIFVMPIAVLDSIHILSEFFDRYPKIKDRKKTLEVVVKELYKPMLFTSLTSAAGFASLALTPIPPVQVFGVFVAIGILIAWLMTMLFIPAYIMLMPEKSLEGFGFKGDTQDGIMSRTLNKISALSSHYPKAILGASLLILGISAYGISLIQINDNPVKWFSKDHDIRVADRSLNEHFGGTYMAYLSISPTDKVVDINKTVIDIQSLVNTYILKNQVVPDIQTQLTDIIDEAKKESQADEIYSTVVDGIFDIADSSETDEEAESWENLAGAIELSSLASTQVFKDPKVLDYISSLEDQLVQEGAVGKINSLTKLLKKINLELHEGKDSYKKLPEELSGVGQCIISYQNSHIPERLRHCVDNDFTGLNLWMQLKSGDNKDMEKTMAAVDDFFTQNEPPISLDYNWFGLTYINVIWQQKMVAGMVKAFLGSFVVVFLMMTFLFRSIKWALLCMLPLSITIALIYGVIGFIGKDYDMPVAVLSSLALGLAIDFSIHFLVRARHYMSEGKSWKEAAVIMFGEPARAITRNIIVIAIGFLPLIFSNLVPYKTVGVLLACILALSGLVTMILLPALINTFEKGLIKGNDKD